MNSTEIMAVRMFAILAASTAAALAGSPDGTGDTAKVLATIEAKAATTKISVRYAKMQNSFLAVPSIFCAMTVASVCPLWRIEANSAPKSCVAPKKMPPMSTHKSTGTQPKMAAWMGPLMGPAPAMDEKWWPSTT